MAPMVTVRLIILRDDSSLLLFPRLVLVMMGFTSGWAITGVLEDLRNMIGLVAGN